MPHNLDSPRPAPVLLHNLQALRAAAALAVVYFHATSEAGLNLSFNIGAHGVDVFFVISGFIISYIAAHAPERFFLRRLIRVVPFYWSATLALFLLAVMFPTVLRSTRPDLPQLVASLAFVPRETSYAGLVPTLVLGWSLNYEMYFYVIFAIALLLSRRWAPVITVAIIGLVLLAIVLSEPGHPSIKFYGRPLVFEFGLGVAVYYLFGRAVVAAPVIRHNVPPLLLWLVLTGAFVMLGVEEHYQSFGASRFLAAGIPAFALVCSALIIERVYGHASRNRVLHLLGESSYILYLVHPYVIYGILRVGFQHRTDFGSLATVGIILILLSVSALAAMAIHIWFERPVLAFLRERLVTGSLDPPVSREALQSRAIVG
jgi:exopolysaccharide production protein ExoZ